MSSQGRKVVGEGIHSAHHTSLPCLPQLRPWGPRPDLPVPRGLLNRQKSMAFRSNSESMQKTGAETGARMGHINK
jgi:hypothetical protein